METNNIPRDIPLKTVQYPLSQDRELAGKVSKKFENIVNYFPTKNVKKSDSFQKEGSQTREVFMSDRTPVKFKPTQYNEEGELYERLISLPPEKLNEEAKSNLKICEFIFKNHTLFKKLKHPELILKDIAVSDLESAKDILENSILHDTILHSDSGGTVLLTISSSHLEAAFIILEKKEFYEKFPNGQTTVIKLKHLAMQDEKSAKIILTNSHLYQKFLADKYALNHLRHIVITHYASDEFLKIIENIPALYNPLSIRKKADRSVQLKRLNSMWKKEKLAINPRGSGY